LAHDKIRKKHRVLHVEDLNLNTPVWLGAWTPAQSAAMEGIKASGVKSRLLVCPSIFIKPNNTTLQHHTTTTTTTSTSTTAPLPTPRNYTLYDRDQASQ